MNAAEQLGRSGDGGVDGVINEDVLGLDRVYVPAKRHAPGSTIGRWRAICGRLRIRPVNRSVAKAPGNLPLSGASGQAESAARMGTGGQGVFRSHVRPHTRSFAIRKVFLAFCPPAVRDSPPWFATSQPHLWGRLWGRTSMAEGFHGQSDSEGRRARQARQA
ncbi:restriction endonuclease [Roseomonas sp. CECT 9278]|uniref:restriction endonuclease n=1 Tax=Roseomonas sp. CECT 9278 TaxID=2845823 RepID=UPI002112AE20|nr:restriction endonuclease [Roseomonas sp. CECT 9278]